MYGLVAKLCLTPLTSWTVACQAPLSMEFSREKYWNGLPFPSSGDFPNPGIEPRSLTLQEDSLLFELPGKPNPIGLFLILLNSYVMPYKNKWHSYGIQSVCHWLVVVGATLSLHMHWVFTMWEALGGTQCVWDHDQSQLQTIEAVDLVFPIPLILFSGYFLKRAAYFEK